MKKTKRFLSAILAVVMLLSTSAFAAEPIGEQIQYLSATVRFSNVGFENGAESTSLSDLFSSENISETTQIGNFMFTDYDTSASVVEEQIYNCAKVNSAQKMNDLFYIDYTTNNDEIVSLCYLGDELQNKQIYDTLADTLVSIDYTVGECQVMDNFLSSAHYEISDEQLVEITSALESNDSYAINSLDGIGTIMDGTSVCIVPEEIAQMATKAPKTNLPALPRDVTFRQYNAISIATT